jgi:hypothetical protein
MSHGTSDHGTHAPLFPPSDIADFRAADKHAGKMIAGLMGVIFSIGLVMYAVVAYYASQGH